MSIYASILAGVISDVFPFAMGLFCLRHLDSDLQVFLVFSTFVLLVDAGILYTSLNKLSNLSLLNTFLLVEYACLAVVFSMWQPNKMLKRLLRTSIGLMLGAWLILWLGGASLGKLSHQFSVIVSIIFIAVSTYTLHHLTVQSAAPSLHVPAFWISVGVLIYFAGNVLLFGATNLFVDAALIAKVWWLHTILSIIANVFYCGGYLSQRRLKVCGSSSSEPHLFLP